MTESKKSPHMAPSEERCGELVGFRSVRCGVKSATEYCRRVCGVSNLL